MLIPGVHEPDPNHPHGMAWIFAAGSCDPRPGGYPKKLKPNQQWMLKQAWEPTSQMLWDFGIRWHPELQKKWIKGGGQFAVAEIVDEPPDEPSMQQMVEDFAEDQFKAMKDEIDRVLTTGTDYEKKRLRDRFRQGVKASEQLARMIEDQLVDLPDEENADKHTRSGRKLTKGQ